MRNGGKNKSVVIIILFSICSLVHHKTQHLKSLFGADIVYLLQLQQVISNSGGGPQLLTQGCVYVNRAASQIGGTFSPR